MPRMNIAEIVLNDDERIRKEMEDQESTVLELADSLKNIGQINPIIVRRDNRVLITGRRRIEAAKRLGWTDIRVEFWEELDPLKQKIVEFDENDKRKQLTWQEKARAISEIFALQKASFGSSWSVRQSATSIGQSPGKVSEYLSLASALDNTRVANRPSFRGALDTLKRERELLLIRELARRRAKGMGITVDYPSKAFGGGIIYNGDCRVILDSLTRDSIDLVIIDPPWGIDFDTAAQWSKKWIGSYDDSPNSVKEMLQKVFRQLYAVLKPSCHMYTFFPIQESEWWVNTLTACGFIVRQRPLVWFKTGQPSITSVYTSFLPCYESILWCYKPGEGDARRLFSHPIPEGFGFPREDGRWHENQKPVDMLARMVESSSEPNEVVLDCFAGGGSTLMAAFSLNRYYVGVEADQVNFTKCVERLDEAEVGRAPVEEESEIESKEDDQ